MSESWRRVRIKSLASQIAEATGQTEEEAIITVLEAYFARLSGPATPAERAAYLRTYLETEVWPALSSARSRDAAALRDERHLFGKDLEGL